MCTPPLPLRVSFPRSWLYRMCQQCSASSSFALASSWLLLLLLLLLSHQL